MRVADFIIQYIHDELGVSHIFTVTGAGLMHLTDAVALNKNIIGVIPHHEQTASMALEAYSRASENFGVGMFTTGPGSTNAITGLGGAWQDSVPCLFIGGQVKRSETSANSKVPNLRQFGVQELNMIPIVESLCKYAITLNEPEKVKFELEKAVYLAKTGRPGPVWLEIPMDVQGAQIIPDDLESYTPPTSENLFDDDKFSILKDLLNESKRPVIIAGQGVRIAHALDIFEKFINTSGIPVVTTYLGIDTLKQDNIHYVGKTGVKGDRPANLAMQNSDLIISIGSSLHVSVIGYDYKQFARAAKKVIIDIDETSHKKNTIDIDLFIQSDAKDILDKLLDLCHNSKLGEYSEWLKKCNFWKEKYRVCLPEYKNEKDGINSYLFIDQLSKQSSENDIFISDAGGTFYSMSQGIQLTKQNQRYITSGAMATMGYSLPAAIGVAFATNNRVLAITGDGSLQQNIQELQTLIQYNLPVKLFVLNNDGLNSTRSMQKNYFESRLFGESKTSGISFPDTLKVSEAYGIKAIRIDSYENLPKVIDDVLSYDGPVVCDVVVPRDQLIIPTVGSKVNDDGSMTSRPLEDMLPFLDRDEYRSNLYVDEV